MTRRHHEEDFEDFIPLFDQAASKFLERAKHVEQTVSNINHGLDVAGGIALYKTERAYEKGYQEAIEKNRKGG